MSCSPKLYHMLPLVVRREISFWTVHHPDYNTGLQMIKWRRKILLYFCHSYPVLVRVFTRTFLRAQYKKKYSIFRIFWPDKKKKREG